MWLGTVTVFSLWKQRTYFMQRNNTSEKRTTTSNLAFKTFDSLFNIKYATFQIFWVYSPTSVTAKIWNAVRAKRSKATSKQASNHANQQPTTCTTNINQPTSGATAQVARTPNNNPRGLETSTQSNKERVRSQAWKPSKNLLTKYQEHNKTDPGWFAA
jgi:hypothetical protein